MRSDGVHWSSQTGEFPGRSPRAWSPGGTRRVMPPGAFLLGWLPQPGSLCNQPFRRRRASCVPSWSQSFANARASRRQSHPQPGAGLSWLCEKKWSRRQAIGEFTNGGQPAGLATKELKGTWLGVPHDKPTWVPFRGFPGGGALKRIPPGIALVGPQGSRPGCPTGPVVGVLPNHPRASLRSYVPPFLAPPSRNPQRHGTEGGAGPQQDARWPQGY